MKPLPLLRAAVLILTGLVGGCSGIRERRDAAAQHKEAADALRLLTTPYQP
jgi:hypothetical protein